MRPWQPRLVCPGRILRRRCGRGPGSAQGGTDVEEHFFQGAWGEYEWECVELVMRYMYLVFGIAPSQRQWRYPVVSNYNGNALTPGLKQRDEPAVAR